MEMQLGAFGFFAFSRFLVIIFFFWVIFLPPSCSGQNFIKWMQDEQWTLTLALSYSVDLSHANDIRIIFQFKHMETMESRGGTDR